MSLRGYTYFAQGTPGGLVKIGFSAYPRRRMTSLFAPDGGTMQCRLLCALYGDRGLERLMHRRFAHLASPFAEWFYPERDLVGMIATMDSIFTDDKEAVA